MKKYILWLLFAAVAVGTALYKPVKDALNEQPVDKNISLAIYRGNSYESAVYNSSSARLHISIVRVTGNKRKEVWSQTCDAKLLKQFPSADKAMAQTITVPRVFSKEHLEVTYTITYDSDGTQLQMENDEVVSGNDCSPILNISI
ncbi:MAG TPA: hypothetical protein PKM63_11985 [Panacibacter sp.]|nr:hypothetical protein [Panacibacter sp.]HNP45000.1 hypothetical protein [Panacibacter sp.]